MANKKPAPNTAPIPIRALAGRTVETYALKALIRDTGAVLTRKGRSANWLLFADKEQMGQIIEGVEQSDQSSWQWLAKLIREKHYQFSHQELLNLVNRNPGISVKQLVAKTDCTMAQARKVIDDAMEL